MKKVATKFEAIIPDYQEVENSLMDSFPDYKISYSVFSDIWRIENKIYSHSIWYNKNTMSKLITKRNKEYKEVIILNILLFTLLFLFIFLNQKYNWTEYSFYILLIVGFLSGSINSLLMKLKPEYKERFLIEHNKVYNKLAHLFSTLKPTINNK